VLMANTVSWVEFVGFGSLWLLVGGVLVFGSVMMRRLEQYELVYIAGVVALLPITPVFPLSLLVGAWALWVLGKPEVRAGFARRLHPDAPPVPPRPAGPGAGGWWRSFRTMFLSSPGTEEPAPHYGPGGADEEPGGRADGLPEQ